MGIEMIYVTVTVPLPSSMGEVKELPRRGTSTVKASCLAGETAQLFTSIKNYSKKVCVLSAMLFGKSHPEKGPP